MIISGIKSLNEQAMFLLQYDGNVSKNDPVHYTSMMIPIFNILASNNKETISIQPASSEKSYV